MEEVKAWEGYYCGVGRQGSIPQHRTLNLRTEGQRGVSQAQGISVGKGSVEAEVFKGEERADQTSKLRDSCGIICPPRGSPLQSVYTCRAISLILSDCQFTEEKWYTDFSFF